MKALLLSCTSLLSLFLSLNLLAQPLNGTYTINPVGGNYTSFTAAVNDLVSKGISGPVQFVVASGTYNEQFTIPAISGVSSTDSILFRSASGDSTSVIINFSSTAAGDNFVVRFNGASRITFRSVTLRNQGAGFSRCTVLDGGNSYIRFNRCEFVSGVVNSTSTNHALVWSPNSVNDTYIRLHNNRFVNSGNSIYNAGGTANTAQLGWEVIGNRFDDFHYFGVYLNQCAGAIVHGNTFSNNVASASTSSYSIYLVNATGTAKVSNNVVDSRGYIGIFLSSITTTSFDPSQVYNNMISLNGGNAIGIYFSGGSNINTYHNSVNLYNTGSSSYGIYTSSGSAFQFRNNIVSNQGLGYAIYIATTGAITASNYNNYYTNGCYLGYWGSARVNLQSWQSGSGHDQNSLSLNPRWNSNTELRTTYLKMDNAGMNLLASVPQDIDGQARSATPCLGADEFTGTPVTPISGVVNVPGTYSTIQAALNAIYQNGISGSVEMRIADGTYNEQLTIRNFDRANAGDSLLIRSLNNDSSKVTIQHTASGASDNFVVLFSHAKGVTLRHIGIIAAGTSFSRGAVLSGNIADVRIDRCRFQANPTTSGSTNFTSIFADDIAGSNIRIVRNSILSNAYGVIVTARSGCENLTGLEITDNQILDAGFRGIELGRVSLPVVSRNRLISPTSSGSFYGIYGYTISGQARFEGNEVVSQGSYPLFLSSATASAQNPGLIANNMFSVNGGNPIGIYLSSVSFYNTYHNSVNLYSTGSSSYGIYTSGGSTLRFHNNIISNYGTGYAIYVGTTGAIAASNYNNYYTVGCYLGYWGSARVDLQSWQSGSGQDQNSLSLNPRWNSNTELRTTYYKMDNAGMNLLASVPLDIDGQARSATPCLGADEFTATPVSPVSGVVNVPGTYSTIQAALNAIYQNGISGSVEVRIADGTYNEQVILRNFDRANAGDSLIIRSLNNDSSKVTIQHTASGASDNFVVLLSHVKGVTLRHIGIIAAGTSFSRGVVLSGNVSDVRIDRCRFQANPTTSGSTNFTSIFADDIAGSNIRIVRNSIHSNAYGIIVAARSGCENLTGLEITDNQILDAGYRGIELGRVSLPVVSRNRLISPTSSASYYGIYGYTISGQARFEGNEVVSQGSYPLFLSSATASALNPSLIANNMFSVSGGNPIGIYLSSVSFYNTYHNSVSLYNTSTSSYSIYTSGGTGLDIRNNIFANYGTGYAIYVGTVGAISQLNHNVYYTRGCWLGYWGSNRGTLAQWQTGSGRDQNSHQFDPRFVSTSDLHSNYFRLMGLGTNLSSVVPTDFDNDPRPSAPSPGADEFSATVLTPITGTITVPGQYATLQAAFDAVFEAGISGTVTINIADGTYTGRTSLEEFSRANPADSLIIQSASRDSSKVNLQYTASGTSDNYIIYMVSPANVVIRDLGFVMGGTAFARAIVFAEQVDGLTVSNCAFVSNWTSGTSKNGSIIYSANSRGKDIAIRHSRFDNGSYGIDITNPGSCQSLENVTVEHNVMNFPIARGIDLLRVTNTYIRNNSILAPGGSTSLYGIYISTNSGQMEVWSNNIIARGPAGIYLTSCAGTSLQPLLVANNMTAMSSASSNGVTLANCTNLKFYHNSMHCFSTTTSSYALYTTGGNNLDIRNNIMSQAGTGYAWYNGTPAAITISDYNILRSNGINLGYWNGNQTTLAAWKTASGKDANSIGTDPQFRSNTDLHIRNTTLKGSGTNLLADVPVDIDGNPRANPPFIGADEIRIDFAVTNVLSPVTGCLYNEDITIRVANPGDAQDSVFVLRYRVNSGTIFVDTLRQLLEPQSAANFTFSQKFNFTNPGTYTITAWISYAGDEGLNNDTATVTITSHPKPTAAFFVQNGCEGTVINFTDNSTVSGATITAWQWAFGDGNSSTGQNPAHTYLNTSGAISVQLIATSSHGCLDTVQNSITVFPKPAASFTATVACEQTVTQFTSTSTVSPPGAITVYSWGLGGGATSSQQNPAHTYPTAGPRSVQLIVTTNAGCRDTTSQTVVVHPKPNADFLISGDVCPGVSVSFTDVSFIPSGVITGYAWAFGDGGTSTLQNDQHSYIASGTYNVTLTVTSNQQCTHSQTKAVEVFPKPVTAFKADDVCDGEAVIFTNQSTISSGSIIQFGWSFGDGNVGILASPSHTYAAPGVYTVILAAVSDKQCADTISAQVEVFALPAKPTLSRSGNTLQAPTGYTYVWLKDNQPISGAISSALTLSGIGTYVVVITDQNGCSNASDPFVITGISTLPDGTTVKVFPNPATDAVWVELNGNYNRQLTVTLYDATGRVAGMPHYLPAGTGSKVLLPTAHLAAGPYWIRLSDAEGKPLTHLPVVVIR